MILTADVSFNILLQGNHRMLVDSWQSLIYHGNGRTPPRPQIREIFGDFETENTNKLY